MTLAWKTGTGYANKDKVLGLIVDRTDPDAPKFPTRQKPKDIKGRWLMLLLLVCTIL
jgi:hypothetical protein